MGGWFPAGCAGVGVWAGVEVGVGVLAGVKEGVDGLETGVLLADVGCLKVIHAAPSPAKIINTAIINMPNLAFLNTFLMFSSHLYNLSLSKGFNIV